MDGHRKNLILFLNILGAFTSPLQSNIQSFVGPGSPSVNLPESPRGAYVLHGSPGGLLRRLHDILKCSSKPAQNPSVALNRR